MLKIVETDTVKCALYFNATPGNQPFKLIFKQSAVEMFFNLSDVKKLAPEDQLLKLLNGNGPLLLELTKDVLCSFIHGEPVGVEV